MKLVHEPGDHRRRVRLYGIPHPTLFGYTIRTSFEKFLLAVALAVVCYLLALRLTRAPFGRLLRAVREIRPRSRRSARASSRSSFRSLFFPPPSRRRLARFTSIP